jgi:hypothetical protein
MPLNFKSFGGFLFGNLGITTSLSGITLSITAYDTASGATVRTSIVPTVPNYVLGDQMIQQIAGSSYQTFTNGVVSLTTVANRPVKGTVHYSSGGNGYVDINPLNPASYVTYIRFMRGPSTVLSNIILQNLINPGTGISFQTWRTPTTSLQFIDLNPVAGAATYLIQAQTSGLSVQIGFNGSNLFVEQP